MAWLARKRDEKRIIILAYMTSILYEDQSTDDDALFDLEGGCWYCFLKTSSQQTLLIFITSSIYTVYSDS